MEKYNFEYLKSGKNFGHSHAVSDGNFIVLSGLVSSSSSDSYYETKDIINQLYKILVSLNLDKYNIMSSNCYIVKIEENFKKFNEAFCEEFQDVLPARTTIGVSGLPSPRLVEIQFNLGRKLHD
jgi:enamine deaminase RidA (YjgF/YER057c/UK114 family)